MRQKGSMWEATEAGLLLKSCPITAGKRPHMFRPNALHMTMRFRRKEKKKT